MKKPVKERKKPVSRRKNTPKTPRRRKKRSFSDVLRAFLLVGVIVALSAVISFAVISLHSSMNKNDDDKPPLVFDTVQDPVTKEPPSVKGDPAPAAETVKTDTVSPPARAPSSAQPASAVNPAPASSASSVTSQKPPEKPAENLGTLVFVIDDAGNNLRELEPFLRIPGPLTIAVLPGLPYSAEAAKRIRAAGKEVILHQPMEALGAQNPGPNAVYSGMSEAEIKSILSHNIEEVGPVAGINNHQGSKVTMDADAMQIILSFCADKGIFFLDSRTTADTVAPALAQKMGIKIGERNIFLDNEQDKESMLSYMKSGLTRAQRNGSAVMIGHTWSPELAPLLAEQFPLLISQGYTLKTASDIIK